MKFGISWIDDVAKAVGSHFNQRKHGKSRNEGPVTEPNPEFSEGSPKLIAVVGITGSGLSQFIHDVTGAYNKGVAPDASLQPYTKDFKAISMESIGLQNPNKITLIDTPGFDYSSGNNEHTKFKNLAIWLRQQYGNNVKLDGVIYMHNIWNEEIYNRSKFRYSQDLEKLCGSQWHTKVILISSHWSERPEDVGEGESNEEKLREGYWSFMIQQGSRMTRYESPGNQELAREILQPFL